MHNYNLTAGDYTFLLYRTGRLNQVITSHDLATCTTGYMTSQSIDHQQGL